MLGRPEAAPGGNNKTQGGAAPLRKWRNGDGAQHTQIECVYVCVCVCVCVCVWRRLSGLLLDSSYPLPYHCLLYRKVIYLHSNFQLLLFLVQSIEWNKKGKSGRYVACDCRQLTLRLLMSYIYIYIYMEHLFLMFLDRTQRRTTVGGTPLDEWSARRRDLYLTTHDTHNRQISMPPVGFEPTISAGERPQVSATSWSLVQRSPAYCAASLCVT